MIKKYILLISTLYGLAFGMQSLDLQQRNEMPSWLEHSQLEQSTMRHTDDGFTYIAIPHLSFPDHNHVDFDDRESFHFEHPDHGHVIETTQLSSRMLRSSVPNPEDMRGWLYKDSCVFPFVAPPDMSNDPEISHIRGYLDAHDVSSLAHEMRSQQEALENTSFIDRTNRYKISRRLSFLAKHVRQNAAMHYLLLIKQAHRLEDACLGVEQLRGFLENNDSIIVNGHKVRLSDQKIAEIMQSARRAIEHRVDYQSEKLKYPSTAAIGGQLLDQSPILNRINMAFYRNLPPDSVCNQQASIDTFTDVLTRRINIHPAVDPQIKVIFTEFEHENSYFRNYVDATIDKLKQFQEHGLLTPPKTSFEYGVDHFFKVIVPNNPLEKPKEFTVNVIRYTALAAIHTWTGGVLIPVQTAAQIALKLHDLKNADFENMSAKEYGEFVAEELADLAYTIAATKLMQKAKDAKIPEGFVQMTREMFEGKDAQVAVAGGEVVSVREPEMQALRMDADQKVQKHQLHAARKGAAVGESVHNITALFEKNDFGRTLKKTSVKTKFVDVKTNSQIYEVTKKMPEFGLNKGDKFYLDKFHGDHIEVFRGKKCNTVLNLDGTVNEGKTAMALAENRQLRIK